MAARHILLLTDRDWTHPQGGGTGANLYGQVTRWVAWGHRVTVVAGSYPGATPVERLGDRLTVHRMGSRVTVFPLAAKAVIRGLARDADVVLEVVNGIAFLAPLWTRRPHVALVHHVHRDHYVAEMGRKGAIPAFLLETLPLRWLYRRTPFVTISEAGRRDLLELGVPEDQIHVGYLGVEASAFREGARSPEPRLLYLGRLKQYKRIELVLDALETLPDAVLDIAGDGDHRPALEAEVARRGLTDRVVFHGHVSEDEKTRLLTQAWVNLTASSAEGWCLTVMEAAACGTPSAALRVGGLTESIVDGVTGALADDVDELAGAVRRMLEDPAHRDALGAAARERARAFTWERAAGTTLGVLDGAAEKGRRSMRASLAESETLKAAGMAAATLATNAIALLFTVLFARLLGAEDYGSLAALISTFLIISVPGSALQVAVARETALGRLGAGARLAGTLAAWRRRLLAAGVAITGAAVLVREPLADLISVEQAWGAAATAPTALLWLWLSMERGVLQGLRRYKPVAWSLIGEASGRVASALALVGAGMGVTGAYLGSPLAMGAAALALAWVTRRALGPADRALQTQRLRTLAGDAWPAVLALFLVAVLQNIDVVLVKRQIGGEAAGAYAAAAVAAKAVIWVAIGIGLWLLPEATRRVDSGEDPRPVLLKALAVVAGVAAPMLVVYAVAPATVLRLAFGAETVQAADALLLLGAAMTLLAAGYLCVQYMLALGRLSFLYALGVVAATEVALLTGVAGNSLLRFAAVVLALQAAASVAVLGLGLARPAPAPAR